MNKQEGTAGSLKIEGGAESAACTWMMDARDESCADSVEAEPLE